MLYILFYETADHYVERREPYRRAHLEAATRAKDAGELMMGGAFDPADGAAIVFRSEDAARDFAAADPYVENGLVSKWWVRAWNVVV